MREFAPPRQLNRWTSPFELAMKKLSTLLLLALSFLTVSPVAQSKESSLVFSHVTVIDVVSGRVMRNMTVVVEGPRITSLGKSDGVKVPRGAQTIDASGKYLIPGLWDMHVHIFNQVSRRAPNAWYFPLFVANGVTGVREMWTKPQDINQVLEWRRQLRKALSYSHG
jgi:adenine deaminase